MQVTDVINIIAGSGGRAPQTPEAVRFAIPESLRHGPLQRAVTLADYADAAMLVPGVARAAAYNFGGIFNTVMVLVDPQGQGGLDPVVRQEVYEQLDQFRLAGREHWVSAPNYVPLEVKLAVCPEPGALPHQVRERVLAALRPGSVDRPGFFHPDKFSFGDDVELGDVLAHVHRVAGVNSVKALVFRRLKEPGPLGVYELIPVATLEVARLDGNDNRPENGVLKVFVMGLDDEILIRQEIKLPLTEPLFETSGPESEINGSAI
jgi:predicted phage baseplate assembly protein